MDSNADNISDEKLAQVVQSADVDESHRAFASLVERYEKKITRYANKFLYVYEDRQDAVQEVFLKAYKNIQSFRVAEQFSPWIYRIAHNTFINVIRKQKRESTISFDTDQIFAWQIPDIKQEEERGQKEEREILDQCLGRLHVKYREPLVLYYFEGKDYTEISEILQMPVATVGVRLRRGRELMKSFINP